MPGSTALRRRRGSRTPSTPSQWTDSLQQRACACSFDGRPHGLTAGAEGPRGIRFRVDEDADERDVHLVPALRAVLHVLGRVRVELIGGRVVVVRDGLELRALGEIDRLGELIPDLPVESV